jgi:alpha-glucosidase
MRDVPIPPERVQDPFEKRVPGIGLGRDPVRTPMQWSKEAHAGFSTAKPWLPGADDFAEVNVEAERAAPRSMLSLHRALIDLRRREPALAVGDYAPIVSEGPVLAYLRERGGRRFLIALNLGEEPARLIVPERPGSGEIVLSTHLDRADDSVADALDLRADEGVILRV